jgi:hypothetical protein
MTFEANLGPVLQLRQRQGRMSHRALKIRFELDGDKAHEKAQQIIEIAKGGLMSTRDFLTLLER